MTKPLCDGRVSGKPMGYVESPLAVHTLSGHLFTSNPLR